MKNNYKSTKQTKIIKFIKVFTLTLTLSILNFSMNAQTYCTPSYATGTGSGDYISLVKIVSTTLNNTSAGAPNPYFTFFPNSGSSTATLSIGSPYSLNVAGGTYSICYISVWGDWNQNGNFEASEFMGVSPNAGALTTVTLTNSFIIPNYALSGTTRIRLRSSDAAPGADASQSCGATNSNFGETEDYEVYMLPLPPCTGNPVASNAISSNTLVCKNTGFDLNLVNGTIASGLEFQWQSSLDSLTWTNLGSIQNNSLFAINSLTATTYYQCITTCTSSAQSATSTPVVVNLNPLINCYCTPQPINCTTSNFTNIIFESINDTSTCAPNGYANNSGIFSPVALNASQNYTISTNLICQTGTGYAGVWIDYNQDGMFDSYEYNDIGSISSGNLIGNIYVPYTALAGNTKMRLKMESTAGTFQGLYPCTNIESEGEIIDYDVIINPEVSCAGTPSAGIATAPSATICDNTPFDLNLLNNDIVSNISYQWQSSPDNAIWTNIGAPQTTVPYYISTQTVTTHYRCVTTCTTSAMSATSTPIAILQNPVTACYCVPPVAICSNYDEINNVVFATLNNTSTCSNNGYEDYSASVASTTVNAGQTYTIAVTVGSDYFGKVSAWIDYDQNGIFDATEYTFLGTTNSAGDTIVNGSINIPSNALIGNTKMRIRNNNQFTFLADDACVSGALGAKSVLGGPGNGETEDYLITILPPDCSSINFPATIAVTGTKDICTGGSTTLDLSPALPTTTGITYQWKMFNGTTFINDGPTSSTSPFTTSPSVNTTYYCEILCNGNPVMNSDTVFVTVNYITTAPIIANVSCFGTCNGLIVLNASSTGSTLSYSWTPSFVGTTDTITGLCAGVYTVNITNAIACSLTQTVTIIEPTSIIATSSQTNASCFGLNDGVAAMLVSGGTSPLIYSWSPSGGNALTASNLSAGNYTFNITDGNNCTLNEFFTILEPSALTAIVSNTLSSCLGGANGQAEILASGGTPVYTYSWTSGGTNALETNLAAGSYSYTVTDANFCTLTQTVLISLSSSPFSVSISGNISICEQLDDTITSVIVGGAGPFLYSWTELPGNVVSNNPDYNYTTSIGTYSYNLSVTDVNNCVVNSNTLSVTVNPSSNISGTVTTNPSLPVAGMVVLYKYLPFFTKFDSVAGQNIGVAGDYNFTSFTSGKYIVKVIPLDSNLQIAYGDSAVNWKTAKEIIHGCAVNDIQNINVKALSTFTTTGTGSLSGTITEGNGFGQKMGNGFATMAPGAPIGGIVVKGGRNPGGQMFVQTTTDPITGMYTLKGLPVNTGNEEYFIVVDIPGLDTNGTYHQIITLANNQYVNLDFVVDSAKINPIHISDVSVYDISAIENQIKVYPNPASDKVTIQYNLLQNSNVKIEVFDILGKSVKTILPLTQQNNREHYYTVQLNDITSGMYFMKLKINNSESVIKLIINN